jgi:hypothetical protein
VTGRILTTLLAAVALAFAFVLGPVIRSADARAAGAKTPKLSDIARASSFRTTTLAPAAQTRLAAAGFWGGPVAAASGETVTLYFSNTYPQDPTVQQKWANFFTQLVHGSELPLLKAYMMPLSEVQTYCGAAALACYSSNDSTLIAPATDPETDVSAEAVVAHEYGHHVATHRNDAPWAAVDYGTKRWSSYEQVCSRTASGELHPGAETQSEYTTNPGEAFAETYRVLNERRLGLPETPWNIVTTSLYPDNTALTLLLQDVTQPWTGPTTTTYRGTSGRAYTVATPLDGNLTLKVSAAPKTRVQLKIGSTSTTTALGGSRVATRAVCGQRTSSVRVTRVAGKGGYTLTVAKP